MAKGCICGKATACEPWQHPRTSSVPAFVQNSSVLHMQRWPGETFAELEKRLAKSAPDT